MKLKWGKADLKYFTKKILVAERSYDWAIWVVLFLVSISGLIYLLVR